MDADHVVAAEPHQRLADAALEGTTQLTEKDLGRKRRGMLAVVLVVALVCGVAWWIAGGSDSQSRARADGKSVVEEFEPGERVQTQPFEASMLSGSQFDGQELVGQVVVYNIWGSWCVPCATEAPALVENAKEYADEVTFVGINVRDNDDSARAFERKYDVPYDSVTTKDSATALLSFQGAMAAGAVPTTLIIDRQGRVAARVTGPVTATTLRNLLTTVLAESDASS